MPYVVQFSDVGRGKRSWRASLASLDDLEKEVIRSRALMSRGVECADGVVYAGLRAVGRYEVLEGPSAKVLALKTVNRKG